MIFVTVGSELPFDRLVRIVDEWAQASNRDDVVAQIGHGIYCPTHIAHCAFLEPPEFRRYFGEAKIVIAHAGMGTVLTALQVGKPLLVMPRRTLFAEVRNDHQLATAEHLRELGKVAVALDDEELRAALTEVDQLSAGEKIEAFASSELVGTVRTFISEVAEQRLVRRTFRHPFGLRSLTRG